jgi:hypothetical protein
LDVLKVTGRLFLRMNKQVLLLPVLIGLLQFAGWRTLPAQQRLEMAERQVNANEKESNPASSHDKDEQKTGRTDREGLEPNEVGRVELNEKQAKNANLDVEVAGPAKINESLQLSGKITFNEDAIANVSAPYPGIVKVQGLGRSGAKR